MTPGQPHSFQPRNPDDAEGRTTCVCGLRADSEPHLRAMLVESVKLMSTVKMCSTLGCANKAHSRGLCRTHLGREVVLSFTLTPERAAEVDRLRGGVSRSGWLRAVVLAAVGERLAENSTTKDPEHMP